MALFAAVVVLLPLIAMAEETKKNDNHTQKWTVILGLVTRHIDPSDNTNESSRRKNVCLCFWVVENCARRYPEVLDQLKEKKAVVEQVVSCARLGKVLSKLMRTDAFLLTGESTTAKHKLPYMITRLANAAGVSTYTLQHGFPNLGLMAGQPRQQNSSGQRA